MGKLFARKGTRHIGNLGFTFIELITVILILAFLIIISLAVLNPLGQIEKAKDATRQNDLNQLNTALDTFYNDKGCYPTTLSQLAPAPPVLAGTPIYIKTIPQDPDGIDYQYLTDTNQCPQWFSLITRISNTPSSSLCSLEQITPDPGDNVPNCLPINYTESGYNYCKISGKVNCSVISNEILDVLFSASPVPTITPNPTLTSTPIPTPTCTEYSACTGGSIHGCNSLGDTSNCSFNVPGGYTCFCGRTCGGTCN